MKVQLSNNLSIADMEGCKSKGDVAIIHACKHPCYEMVVGKDVDKLSPHFFFVETGNNLYLNIIDPDESLFQRETFDVALWFIKKHINERKVIIHCNEGKSRSPSIAMLYLFKDLPYREAQNKMIELYPDFEQSLGIDEYLGTYWWNWYGQK